MIEWHLKLTSPARGMRGTVLSHTLFRFGVVYHDEDPVSANRVLYQVYT